MLLGCFEPPDTLSTVMRAIKGIHLAGKRVDSRKKYKRIISSVGRVLPSQRKIFSTGCAKFVAARVTITGANKVRGEVEKRVAVPTLIPDALTPLLRLTFLSTLRINTP